MAIVVSVSLCVAAIIFCLVLGQRVNEERPAELRGAKLLLNERLIQISNPIPLSGRPDQVWRTRDGVLVLIDTKTRRTPRVYEYDRVQLSAYAMLLRHSWVKRRGDVAPYGFIRFKSENGVRFVRVLLYDDEHIFDLYDRFQDVARSSSKAVANPSRALCAGCGHAEGCDAVAR
ncbi:MAG: PD-(D/E)XK nuclease family protein [Pseudomonadota bacterium]